MLIVQLHYYIKVDNLMTTLFCRVIQYNWVANYIRNNLTSLIILAVSGIIAIIILYS